LEILKIVTLCGTVFFMSVNDLVADALTRIRNGCLVGAKSVSIRASKLVISILNVLRQEGFIQDYSETKDKAEAIVYLKYLRNGRPVLNEIKLVSKRSRRVYVGSKEIPKVARGLGVAILSTSSGVLSDLKARELNVGGELICTVR